MKDVPQCLVAVVDKRETCHSKSLDLEDENTKILKMNKVKLLQEKHDKLYAKYSFVKNINEELRDENAQMNAEVLGLRDKQKKFLRLIKALRTKLNALMAKDDKVAKNDAYLLSKIENLENELKNSQKSLAQYGYLEKENQELKQRHNDIVNRQMQNSTQYRAMQEQLFKIQTQRDKAYENIKQIHFESKGMQKLYKHVLHEKEDLIKKVKALSIERYNTIYEEKNLFGIDTHVAKDANVFVDIDSLIDGIGSQNLSETKSLS